MENAVSDRGTVQNLPHSALCKINYSSFNKREIWDHKTSLISPHSIVTYLYQARAAQCVPEWRIEGSLSMEDIIF